MSTQNPYFGYAFALSRTDFPKQPAAVADAMVANVVTIMTREFPGLQCVAYRKERFNDSDRVTYAHPQIQCEVVSKMLLHYAANIGFKRSGNVGWMGVGYHSSAPMYKFAWIPRAAAFTAPMRLDVPKVGEVVLAFVGRNRPAYEYYSGYGHWRALEFALMFPTDASGVFPVLEAYPFTDNRPSDFVYPKIKAPFYA